MCISSMTHDQEMTKTIAINLYDGVCGTLHANPGVHSLYNLISAPPRFRQTAFISVSPPTIIKYLRGTSSEDLESKHL